MKANAILVTLLAAITVLSSKADAQFAHGFPKDPNQPVLKVEDYYLAKGSESLPLIQVYADGRVVKQVSKDRKDDFEISLGEKRLKELLTVIIEENKFLEMDAEDIKDEVLSERKRKRLRPGYEFRIEMNLADDSHVVSVGNTWVYQRLIRGRSRHKDAKVFLRFLNVEELCRQVSNWTLVGGEAAMKAILYAANEVTQEKHPGAPEISEASILSLKPHDGGKVVMYLGVASTPKNPALHVIVTKAKGEKGFDVKIKINKPRQIHGKQKPPPSA